MFASLAAKNSKRASTSVPSREKANKCSHTALRWALTDEERSVYWGNIIVECEKCEKREEKGCEVKLGKEEWKEEWCGKVR